MAYADFCLFTLPVTRLVVTNQADHAHPAMFSLFLAQHRAGCFPNAAGTFNTGCPSRSFHRMSDGGHISATRQADLPG